ncbi:uncharacterized protein SETTUDRAFT_18787 [Exserohilum turcica Et28A]|uniref:Cellobiose dehydrogenase n=1 Tax=Exserohilum turcicum (strain 28A) TaxID=671987 RepID=R0KWT3_EXST2|nr:uncharacterized protein SETTUDRAFT_18787 [Exserohilum turcica Et28A]EOA92137.1 hypothetical protein SETTUDRAFT_18787 [Exserohilum turcica Et28A]
MRVPKSILVTGALICIAQGQCTKRYCDSQTLICYVGWTSTNGITFGIALPATKTAPFDTVLQIVSPVKNGWVGFSWGGTMPYVPLTIEAEYAYIKGTGYNETHWTLTVRCRGCSQWLDVDGNTVSIDADASAQKFGYGVSNKTPAEPANNRSAFDVHNSFGHYKANLTQGHNADFDRLIAANLMDEQPAVSSAPVPSSVLSIRPTSTSTRVTSSTSPGPIQTSMPTSCDGVNKLAFAVRTAKGWKATKVAGGLTQPRGLIFDTAGNLLIVQNGFGITAHKVSDSGCLESSKTLIAQRNLNHGIVVSQDGKTLYASSATTVFAWKYDADTMSVLGNATTIVTGMDTKGHVTRSLSIPPKHPNLLLVSHGSNENIDYGSIDIKTGRACIKVFNTTSPPPAGYNYTTAGHQLGYGLRNEVGLAFDASSHLWGVENSADDLHRTLNGTATDIHNDNPADELNYIGDAALENKNWYGYPTCFTVYAPAAMPDQNFTTGDQFVLEPNATFNDATCNQRSIAPRVALPAHSTPLEAKFNVDFSALFVTLHGSWNRRPPVGFKVIQVPFSRREGNVFGPNPVDHASEELWEDIFWNEHVDECAATSCFRPVGLAVDVRGRVYVSSDSGAEGEVVVLERV